MKNASGVRCEATQHNNTFDVTLVAKVKAEDQKVGLIQLLETTNPVTKFLIYASLAKITISRASNVCKTYLVSDQLRRPNLGRAAEIANSTSAISRLASSASHAYTT